MELSIPCSYQGGKSRLARDIVDIMLQDNNINENTKFYDLCSGSGAVTIELINRGIHPTNITMVDIGMYGLFWNYIASDAFEIDVFEKEVNKMPEVGGIQQYLQHLSNKPVNKELEVYHYLLLQAGSFGGKQISTVDDSWSTHGFRSYWQPTETSKRRSPVNPMMPMPDTLLKRVEVIDEQLSGIVNAINNDVFEVLGVIERDNAIVYVDPPYVNTTGYKDNFDVNELITKLNDVPLYVSEGYELDCAVETYLLSKGRLKGGISGDRKRVNQEWLNVFK